MKIKIINKSKNKLPAYATSNSAGMDLRAFLEKEETILSKENQNYVYIWVVQKVQHGLLKDCWLTTSVSFPKYDGDSI